MWSDFEKGKWLYAQGFSRPCVFFCHTINKAYMKNLDSYMEIAREVRREVEHESEQLTDRLEQLNGFMQLMDRVDDVLAENKRLQEDVEALQQQLAEEKRQRAELEMKLAEMNKLSAGMARKTSEEELLKALRTYANHSKRKTSDKRAFAKAALLEIANVNGLVLPAELASTIECLDDEQSEPKIVAVSGNYNDIHDNGEVRANV